VFLLHFDIDIFCIIEVKLKSDFFASFSISGVSKSLSFIEKFRVLGSGKEQILNKFQSEGLFCHRDQEKT
jgi:hypothetical protein